jgi:hypothetical protein
MEVANSDVRMPEREPLVWQWAALAINKSAPSFLLLQMTICGPV